MHTHTLSLTHTHTNTHTRESLLLLLLLLLLLPPPSFHSFLPCRNSAKIERFELKKNFWASEVTIQEDSRVDHAKKLFDLAIAVPVFDSVHAHTVIAVLVFYRLRGTARQQVALKYTSKNILF